MSGRREERRRAKKVETQREKRKLTRLKGRRGNKEDGNSNNITCSARLFQVKRLPVIKRHKPLKYNLFPH